MTISNFYPRPPGGGRPPTRMPARKLRQISIHALRVEGDKTDQQPAFADGNFYPRPPGGGRPVTRAEWADAGQFLSTPSGWRATHRSRNKYVTCTTEISIHALRVEGDSFISPSALADNRISIHALRVEGDSKNGQSFHLFLRKREKNLPL